MGKAARIFAIAASWRGAIPPPARPLNERVIVLELPFPQSRFGTSSSDSSVTRNVGSERGSFLGEGSMAVCVSLIDMKGGVGKTVPATPIAWYATRQRGAFDDLEFPRARPCHGSGGFRRVVSAVGEDALDEWVEMSVMKGLG
jgi:hypothetical protein